MKKNDKIVKKLQLNAQTVRTTALLPNENLQEIRGAKYADFTFAVNCT